MSTYFSFISSISVVFLSFYFLTTVNANSYIDPGSGSIVLQIVIASVLGTLTLIKIYWSRLKVFFAGLLKKQPNNEPNKK